jgi:hypothetical protein
MLSIAEASSVAICGTVAYLQNADWHPATPSELARYKWNDCIEAQMKESLTDEPAEVPALRFVNSCVSLETEFRHTYAKETNDRLASAQVERLRNERVATITLRIQGDRVSGRSSNP